MTAKCLRCGADSSWLQGRVPDESGAAKELLDNLVVWMSQQDRFDRRRSPWRGIQSWVRRQRRRLDGFAVSKQATGAGGEGETP